MNLPTRSHHEARNGFRKGSAGLRERCVNQTSFVFHFSFLRFAPACRVQNAMNKIACLFPQMRGLASTAWATSTEQARNRRSNVILEFNGKRQHLSDWSKELGIKRTTLVMRLKCYGWSVDRALSTTVGKR